MTTGASTVPVNIKVVHVCAPELQGKPTRFESSPQSEVRLEFRFRMTIFAIVVARNGLKDNVKYG